MNDKPTVLLIDFSNLFWSAWHSSGADSVSMARQRTRESIERAANSIPGCLVAVCLDAGRSFRKDLLDGYKANRPEKDAAVLAEMDRCKEALRGSGYLLWAADGFEADDVIATAALAANEAGHPFVVASADKDLLQLLALPESKALRTHTWAMIEAKDVEAKFGVTPYKLGDWLALVGDKSDNVPGCPGVGDKRATDLLQRHGSLAELYRKIDGLHVGTGTGGAPYVETKTPAAAEIATPAIVNALWVNRGAVMLARKIVTLRTDAPIKFEEIYERRQSAAAKGAVDMDDKDVPISKGPGAAPPAEGATVTPIKSAEAPAPEVAAEVVEAPSQPTRALVVASADYERQLEPTSPQSAIMMGRLLFESRLYTRFGTAEAVTAVIIRGREMGLGALTSLDSFHVIEGKPCPHAHLIVSLAEARPECEYFMLVESTNERATYETKHRAQPKPVRHTYTVQDAVDAGLCGLKIEPRTAGPGEKDKRGNWDKRRAEMLRKTCAVQLARIVYPAAALGLYSIEEMQEAA
jgi:5'-3' exonuclease